jgi:hypothetical protein
MQPGFLSQFFDIKIPWGLFFLKPKFKLEKNEKKFIKNSLVCNVCQRIIKIQISQFQE